MSQYAVQGHTRRTGITILETIVACTLLTAAMVALVPVMVAAAAWNVQLDQRATALRELRNVIELAEADTDPDRVIKEFISTLPDSQIDRNLSPLESPPGLMRCEYRLQWSVRTDITTNVTLIVWKPAAEANPIQEDQ